jgi:hypothetical protein
MPPNRYRGPPMTLANMRENGVRSLWVVCPLCHQEAVVNVDSFGPDVPVPAFGPRMVCTAAEFDTRTLQAVMGHRSIASGATIAISALSEALDSALR